MVDVWRQTCGAAGLAIPRKLTQARRRKIAARARDSLSSLDAWRAYFERVAASPFLRGETGKDWRADFDWCVRSEDNVSKVTEGQYDAREAAQSPQKQTAASRLLDKARAAEGRTRAQEHTRGEELAREAVAGLLPAGD